MSSSSAFGAGAIFDSEAFGAGAILLSDLAAGCAVWAIDGVAVSSAQGERGGEKRSEREMTHRVSLQGRFK